MSERTKSVCHKLPLSIISASLVFTKKSITVGLLLLASALTSPVSAQTVVNICDRTTQVEATILRAISATNDCTAVTMTQLATITELDLSFMGIGSLQADDFAGLHGLTELDLMFNNLTTLPANLFDDLTSLTSLDLFANNLSTLPVGVFDNLTSLTRLDLQNTSLSALPADIFDLLTNLAELDLSGNDLSTLPTGIFSALTNLTVLDLGSNNLSTLPANVFDNLRSLTELNFFANNLSTLPANVFDNLGSLTELYLGINSLTTLPAGVFDNLTNLTELDLFANGLTTLPAGVFDNLTNLTELDLFDNDLTALPANVFDNLTNLTELNLGGSGDLSTLDAGVFDNLMSLTRLNLGSNDLSTLDAGVFDNLMNLAELDLSGNDLSTLPAGLFNPLTALTSLDLSFNSLTMLPSGIFSTLTNLTELVLRNNSSLGTLESNVFSALTNLTRLDLQNTGLSALPAGLFTGLTNLTFLGLDGNNLSMLPANLFDPLPSDATIEIDLSPIGGLADIPSLSVSGTTTITVSDAFISRDSSGDDRALSFTVTPVTPAVATASESGGVVTIEGVGAGTTDVTVTATDVSGTATQTISVTVVNVGIVAYDAMSAGNQTSTVTIANENSTAMFYVELQSAPVGDVILSVTSDETAEGTVMPATLTFTTTNWNMRQAITVTAVDDNIVRDDSFMVDFAITTGDGGNYLTTTTLSSVTVMVTDDETAPTTITLSGVTPLTVAETAGATEITITATIEGTALLPADTIVTVSVGGGTATSGTDYTAVANFDLTIPALSLSATGTFMIDPTEDTTDDNNETVMINGTAGGFTVNATTLTILEAGILVYEAATAGNPISTITIANENSGTITFYVQLISAPASDITLSVMSSDTNEGTVSPGTLTFTTATGTTSWDTRQALTVTAVPDDIDRDDTFTVDFVITTGSGDYNPATLTIPSVTVTVTDDDTAGIALFDAATGTDAPSITTTEGATTDTFYVALESEPTGTVTVTIDGLDTTEHTSVPPSTLTFTPTGATAWNIRQAITLTGVNDDVVDGDQVYDLTLTASGGGYDSVTAPTVSVTNTDDDTAELTIADMTVDEDAGTATLTVTLTPAVTAGDIMVDGTTTDDTATIAGGDYTALTSQTLTFTAGSTTQTLDIPINNDTIDEADETFTVMLDNLMLPTGVTTVSIADATATVTITDDDTLSDTITLSVSPSTVAETADTTTITVTATLEGTAVSTTDTTVTVSVGESGDSATEGTDYTTIPDFTLTISAESASGMATFMIDPTDDMIDDNNEVVTISGTAPGFTTVNTTTLTIVEAGILVRDTMSAGSQISTTTIAEASGNDMLYVQLASQPATSSSVTISVTSDDTNEGMVTPTTLTFTDTTWNVRQALTVTAVPDNVDRDDTFMVNFAIMSGDGANYTSSLTLPSVTVTVTDDDTVSTTIGLSVSPSTVAETADATTITVTATIGGTVVSTMPTAVTVSVGGGTATSGTDYTAVPDFTLTIPALSLSAMATFMIDPTDDTADDNNETVMITGTATGGFTTVTPATLTIIEGLNTQQREALHGQLLGVINQTTMQVVTDVLSQRLQPRARTEAYGSVAGHVLGLQEGQAVDWQKRLSLVVYSTLQRLDEGGALLVPVDATTFNNSEFALPLEVGESVVVLWGALGSSTVEGGQSDAGDYDGDLIAVLLGIDSMIGEHARLGIAASYEHSELDYQLDMTNGDAVQTMTSIQPYLSWQPHDSVGLWLLGGYGFGDYDATESTAGGTTLRAKDADVERWMAALGFHYTHRFGSSGWDMVLNNKALWNRTVRDATRFDDGSLLPKNVSANWRARLESEVGYSWTFGDGSVRPYGLASVRWDGGDVVNDDTTFMVDAGGGVELSFASRLSMDFKVRRQVTDGDHEEHSVVAVGSFGFAEHEDGQGWQVALERSLLGGLSAPERNKAGFDFEQSDSTPTIGQSPSLQANVGYGRLINPLNDAEAGLLKTYTRFYLDPDENKRHALGLGFDFASLQLGVESEYNNGEFETLLRGYIDF